MAYAELKEKVKQKVLDAPGEDKELYTATVIKKEETNGDITLRTTITVGNKGIDPNPNTENPFTEGWMYGDWEGDCSQSPSGMGRDACTELTYWTNHFKSIYHGNEVYIFDLNTNPYVALDSFDDYFTYQNPPSPSTNKYQRLLIYQDGNYPYQECIETDEMNWYYHQLYNIVYNMVPQETDKPEWANAYGKDFVQILPYEFSSEQFEIIHGSWGTKDWSNNYINHHYLVEYRHAIYVGDSGKPTSIIED